MARGDGDREKWVRAGLAALARGGPHTVRVEVLAKELGVTKGSFYWHFRDRQALLDALLDGWEGTSVDAVIADVDSRSDDARERLRRLFALARSQPDLLAVDLAIRDWARRDPAVMQRLRRVDNRRMDYMRDLFNEFAEDAVDAEARCSIVFSLFVGLPFVAAEHGSMSRAKIVERCLDLVLR